MGSLAYRRGRGSSDIHFCITPHSFHPRIYLAFPIGTNQKWFSLLDERNELLGRQGATLPFIEELPLTARIYFRSPSQHLWEPPESNGNIPGFNRAH